MLKIKIMFKYYLFFLKDLRIKGELLERKITEVEQLKLRIINNVEGNSANSAHPNSAPAAPVADEVDQHGYQTFPKQKTPKSSKTPDRVIKQVSTSLKRSSNARHSVQICQVCQGYNNRRMCNLLDKIIDFWKKKFNREWPQFIALSSIYNPLCVYLCTILIWIYIFLKTQIYSYRIHPIKTMVKPFPLAKLMQKDSLEFEYGFS